MKKKTPANQNKEFFEAIELLEKEKGIPADYLLEKVCAAIVTSVRKDYGGEDVVFCDCNPEKYELRVYLKKTVVEEVTDENSQISVDEAAKYKKAALPGDVVEIVLEPKEFGRIAAQTAKNVIRQGIRDAERGLMMREFQSKQQELVTGRVQRIDPRTGNVTLEIGKSEAVLPKGEQVPDEEFTEGELVKIYIVDVRDTEKGPKAMISRTHPGLVKRLFETEVPEIYEGEVEIKGVAREAGSKTKIAVYSKDEKIDPVGACIGPRGARINEIIAALGGEKIEVIPYSEDPHKFIAAALAPANVLKVEQDPEQEKACHVTVPDTQLSLAIGNKGQNARLAAKLTGWKIDIKPESGFYVPQSNK
ncbi:MAG: transcription termination factor NusA [Oscillospiraceae bacterium]|nr:transcription termination factor NusA [Oscillospiraceae bacterium]MDD7470183.1 transcription termination factor NusA [Oscillospiraceae bacterium]